MHAALSLALLPSFALALVCAGSASAAEKIKPGYWESSNQVLSPIRSTSTEKRCITPAEVDKFMMGPSNRHYACTYPIRSFEGGKILLKGTCVSKKGQQVALSGEGAYTATTLTLTADVATEIIGIPIAGKVRTESRRIADACPPPEAAPAK